MAFDWRKGERSLKIVKEPTARGGKVRDDDADLWLRENDPAYLSRDRDLRHCVKRLPPDQRAA